MSSIAEEVRAGHDQHGHHGDEHCHTVDIYVDNKRVVLHPGHYDVPTLKKLSGVPKADDLDQLIDSKLKPIPDDATIHIRGCEIFIAHIKEGGSS
jgi:hypothetical protein